MNARRRRHRRAGRRTRVLRLAPTALAALALLGLQALPVRAQDVPGALDFTTALSLARQGPSVAAAELAVRAAQAQLAASFPAVSGSLQTGVSQAWSDSGGVASQRGGLEPFALSATFNVVPYGPAHDARLDAEQALAAARWALEDAARQATVDAAGAYLQVLRAQRQIELDARAVDLAAASADHARSLQAAGDATAATVADAELALAQARTALATDRLARATALADLSDLVGRSVAGVDGEPTAAHTPTAPPSDDALQRRSDVRRAEQALDAARRAYAAGVRSVLPTARASASLAGGDGATSWGAGLAYGTGTFQPSLQANVDPGGTTSSSTGTLQGTRLSLALTIDVPLDTGVGAALEGARLSVRAAESELERTRRRAALAIGAAERAVAAASLQADLAAAQRARAAAQADEAARRAALGLVAGPELARVRLDADDAELTALAADDAVLIARLELAQALGLDPMEVF